MVAPLWPQAVQRAQRRSVSLDAAARPGREVVQNAVLQPQTLRIAHTPRAQTRRMTHTTGWIEFPARTAAWTAVDPVGMVASAR
jgi:hypothetical protein